MHLILKRGLTTNGAVLGILTGLSKTLYTLEDQWRGNQRGVSCIPAGTYEVRPHGWDEGSSVRFKEVWQLQNVPGRSAILIHAGNYHSNTEGCILPGLGLVVSQTQSMVTESREAIKLMRKEIGEQPFTISIDGFGV